MFQFRKKEILQESINCTRHWYYLYLVSSTLFAPFAVILADGYEVHLDNRKLKSPSGLILQLPTELLANAIALEWDSQKDVLKFHTMPLVSSRVVIYLEASHYNSSCLHKISSVIKSSHP